MENPQYAMSHMNLGVVLQKKGDYQGAMTEYQAAQAIDPTNQTIRLNIGTLFQVQGNTDMAIKAYNSILEINPTNTLAHYYRATALKQLGMGKEAISEFLIVLKLDPGNVQAKKAMYEAVRLSPNPDEVLATLEGFARDNPTDAYAQYNYAYELHSRKKVDEALPYYQKTIIFDPKFIDAYLNLASIYKEKSDYANADSILKNALAVDPNNKKAQDLLKQINADSIDSKYQLAAQKYTAKDYQGVLIYIYPYQVLMLKFIQDLVKHIRL